MKNIVLCLPAEADEALILAGLHELQQRTPFYLASEAGTLPGSELSPAEIEAEILLARQGQAIPLAEARRRFAL